MHENRITCASCDFHVQDYQMDGFDLPICRWCRQILATRPMSFLTILEQRAYLKPLRITTINSAPVTPAKPHIPTKWSYASRQRLSR